VLDIGAITSYRLACIDEAQNIPLIVFFRPAAS